MESQNCSFLGAASALLQRCFGAPLGTPFSPVCVFPAIIVSRPTQKHICFVSLYTTIRLTLHVVLFYFDGNISY